MVKINKGHSGNKSYLPIKWSASLNQCFTPIIILFVAVKKGGKQHDKSLDSVNSNANWKGNIQANDMCIKSIRYLACEHRVFYLHQNFSPRQRCSSLWRSSPPRWFYFVSLSQLCCWLVIKTSRHCPYIQSTLVGERWSKKSEVKNIPWEPKGSFGPGDISWRMTLMASEIRV